MMVRVDDPLQDRRMNVYGGFEWSGCWPCNNTSIPGWAYHLGRQSSPIHRSFHESFVVLPTGVTVIALGAAGYTGHVIVEIPGDCDVA